VEKLARNMQSYDSNGYKMKPTRLLKASHMKTLVGIDDFEGDSISTIAKPRAKRKKRK